MGMLLNRYCQLNNQNEYIHAFFVVCFALLLLNYWVSFVLPEYGRFVALYFQKTE